MNGERLIKIKGRNKVKDALSFNALTQKYVQDKKWRCRSCGQCYLCCFDVKEDVDRTVRGRAREQDDTEDDRQRQRTRVQGDEPAEDDGESEDDDEVPEAIMPTQLAPTQASLTTQPAAAVGE